MSSLVLLGSLGTIVSTISMLPHLLHAIRNRKPAGSAFAWTFGAFSSSIWLVYGVAVGDMLVAAPNVITVPAGLGLALWCAAEARMQAELPVMEIVPAWDPADGYQSGDTLEMARIVA